MMIINNCSGFNIVNPLGFLGIEKFLAGWLFFFPQPFFFPFSFSFFLILFAFKSVQLCRLLLLSQT